MIVRLGLALVLCANGAAAAPVRVPHAVLTDLQYAEIGKFVELVLGHRSGDARRAGIERGLRDKLVRLAEREPARLPQHVLMPFTSSLEGRVDQLATELKSILALVRDAEPSESHAVDRDDAISRALVILALHHVAVGSNGGERDEFDVRYVALANVVLWGSLLMIITGATYDVEVLVMKGMEGAAITVAMALAMPLVSGVRGLFTRRPNPSESRARVAERAHRRFWEKVAPAIGKNPSDDPNAESIVRILLAHESDPLAACERMIGGQTHPEVAAAPAP